MGDIADAMRRSLKNHSEVISVKEVQAASNSTKKDEKVKVKKKIKKKKVKKDVPLNNEEGDVEADGKVVKNEKSLIEINNVTKSLSGNQVVRTDKNIKPENKTDISPEYNGLQKQVEIVQAKLAAKNAELITLNSTVEDLLRRKKKLTIKNKELKNLEKNLNSTITELKKKKKEIETETETEKKLE